MCIRYANRIGHTDVTPYEIIKDVNGRVLHVRAMKTELNPDWKPDIVPGGFVGHCTNNYKQEWNCTSNPEGRVTIIRQHKDGRWYSSYHDQFVLSEKPQKFYDYNF